jgi:hypothetical protein
MCIVTGPRIDLAIAQIDRMKKLFSGKSKGLATVFDSKETVIELNGVKIEAFPSHHLDAVRGLPNVSFILLDEADFFPPGQQQDARDVSERYIAKSNLYIVIVSTPMLLKAYLKGWGKSLKILVCINAYFWTILTVLVRYTQQKK